MQTQDFPDWSHHGPPFYELPGVHVPGGTSVMYQDAGIAIVCWSVLCHSNGFMFNLFTIDRVVDEARSYRFVQSDPSFKLHTVSPAAYPNDKLSVTVHIGNTTVRALEQIEAKRVLEPADDAILVILRHGNADRLSMTALRQSHSVWCYAPNPNDIPTNLRITWPSFISNPAEMTFGSELEVGRSSAHPIWSS